MPSEPEVTSEVFVFLVYHVHSFSPRVPGFPPDEEDVKLIGVYSTESAANAAVRRAGALPGFSDDPEGFEVVRYQIDKDEWTHGYVTE
jgi:hypothetical protein